MFYRKWIYGTLPGLLILTIILAGIIYFQNNSKDLKVIFFNVGQGDAILISQGGNQVLIDGGKDGKIILEKLGKYIPFWDRTIETVMATHPDRDHIGGLVDVMKTYKVNVVLKTKVESESQTYKSWEDSLGNARKVEAAKGIALKFSNGAEARVIYPFSSIADSGNNSNDYSMVVKLNFGDDSFLFTGDLPIEKESVLINNQSDVKADVLKVAHHGSKYSTGNDFLNAVNPEEAIISVGKNNTYGHPAGDVLDRLRKHGATIWRTDEMGDVIYKCKAQSSKCKVEFQ